MKEITKEHIKYIISEFNRVENEVFPSILELSAHTFTLEYYKSVVMPIFLECQKRVELNLEMDNAEFIYNHLYKKYVEYLQPPIEVNKTMKDKQSSLISQLHKETVKRQLEVNKITAIINRELSKGITPSTNKK